MAVEDLHSALISNGGGYVKHSEQKSFLVSLAKWVLKSAMWLIFVAWIALFSIIATEFGETFYPEWVAATDGTLFGETGSLMLLFCPPIMAIAFLAVPYIIFRGEDEEQLQRKKEKNAKFSLWTFPVLVDGPLGVVSAAEMIGIIFFIVFVLSAIYFDTAADFVILGAYGGSLTEEEEKCYLEILGLRFGLIGLFCLSFLFLPVSRGSVLLRLINIPFEHATRYHVWLGHLTMLLFTIHGLLFVVVWTVEGVLLDELLEWAEIGFANLPGVIGLIAGLLMWITALPPVRRLNFEVFLYTHQLYVIFIVFLALHVGSNVFAIVAGSIFIFILDRFLRFCQSRRVVDIISAKCLPCGSVELVLAKPASKNSSPHN